MRYDGFDTHNNELFRIGNNLEDLFGATGGLATTMAEISTLNQAAKDNLVLYFSSDFGRQLRANGDAGTDHGLPSKPSPNIISAVTFTVRLTSAAGLPAASLTL